MVLTFEDKTATHGERFDLTLDPLNYLFASAANPGVYCEGVFPHSENETLIGMVTTRNVLVEVR